MVIKYFQYLLDSVYFINKLPHTVASGRNQLLDLSDLQDLPEMLIVKIIVLHKFLFLQSYRRDVKIYLNRLRINVIYVALTN